MPIPIAQVQPAPRVTLVEVLTHLRWSVAERGVLLVVAAEKVRLPRGERLSHNPMLRETLPRFGRKLMRAGGIWAIAPEKVRALPDWRGVTPEKLSARAEHPLIGLFGALDKSAWKKVGNEGGLSRADLPPKLQPLFDALFSSEATLEHISDEGERNVKTLSSAQSQGARLNVRWSNDWSLPIEGKTEFDYSTRDSDESLPDTNTFLRHHLPELYPTWRFVPNVGKTSDLDFEALDQVVSLEGVHTVKELIELLSRATGLELYADVRIEPLSVRFQGNQARAGEVLEALCLALGGAVRRLENTYVLTEERVPWAKQSITQDELFRRASWLQQQGRQRLTEKLRKDAAALRAIIKPLPNEPHPDDVQIWEKGQKSDRLKTNQLPQDVQNRVREIAAKFAREAKEQNKSFNDEPIHALGTDHVRLSSTVVFWLTIPGHGAVRLSLNDNDISNTLLVGVRDDTMPPSPPDPPELKKPVIWPAAWTTRIVRIAPATPEEAAKLATAARSAGMTDLWLDVPAELATARALIKAVAKSGLPVTLVVAPLARPAGTDGDGLLSDRLATGETTDQFTARHNHDVPEGMYQENVAPRFLFPTLSTIDPVIALARLPEVRGIVVTQFLHSGYQRDEPLPDPEIGYVTDLRLEFLRRWHVDPVDIVPAPYFGPFDEEEEEEEEFTAFRFHPRELPQHWLQHRSRYAKYWRKTLRVRLKLTAPTKPVFVGLPRYGNTNFCLWNDVEQLPSINDEKSYFVEIMANPNISPERTKMFLNVWIHSQKGPRFLLDLTKVNALEYLQQLKQPSIP